jgi:hypothetical protein
MGRRLDGTVARRDDDHDDPSMTMMMMMAIPATDSASKLNISSSSSSAVDEQLQHTVAAAHMLRRILEDYLEVDASADADLHDLMQPELLVQYFQRIHVEETELIFDVDQRADKVLHCSC